MTNQKIIFFRNDDLRGKLDESLIEITQLFINNNIPISHAVEPANVSESVVKWLLEIKKEYPNLIEIVQHGYSHQLKYKEMIGGKLRKGEFGGNRTYDDQYKDIKEGKELMDKFFGDLWLPVFTFPYGARNNATLKAVDNVGYKIVNGGISPYFKQQVFYTIGRILKKEYFLKRRVSWNLKYKPNTKLFQIDLGISFINNYIDEEVDCTMFSMEELKKKTRDYLKLENTGVILHHRYHNTPEKIKLIEDYLIWVKSLKDIQFLTQEQIYNLYK